MRRHLFIATLALAIAASGAARAADPIAISFTSNAVTVPVAASTFDWSGFYAGVYGGAATSDGSDDVGLALGIDAGFNAQLDFVLVGAEVALEGTTNEPVDTAYGEVLGRAGLVLTDAVMVYAAAGYGFDLSGDGGDILAGGGVEMAVNDSVSVRAQYLRGFADEGDAGRNEFTLGANFHF